MIPAIGIVGRRSNVGKTETVTRLIEQVKKHGYRVATIKHDVHGFDIDHPGKDTYRHFHAGADQVIISSKEKFAMIERVEEEYHLKDILLKVKNVDLIIVEGYKNSHLPKIEVLRKGINENLYTPKENLLAIVSDYEMEEEVPVFSIDKIEDVFRFIETKYLK